jgi:membrane protease YdiL (CAAX protease family)
VPWLRGAPEITGIAVLALHNVAVHRVVLSQPGDTVLNLATAGGLVMFARRAGCSAKDLGLSLDDAGAGMRFGVSAGVAVAAMMSLAAVWPVTRVLFTDVRITEVPSSKAAYNVALRIPLATALVEEALFRGALLGLVGRRRSPTIAVLQTSALFGAWHVLAAIDDYNANPARVLFPDTPSGRLRAVLATTLATATAGVALAWLRLGSGSLIAPITAHAALNVSGYLATRSAKKQSPNFGPAS